MLDILNIFVYHVYTIMNENKDKELIEHFLNWSRYHRFNLTEMARLVGRSKAWGSLLDKDKIKRLQRETKNNIEYLLGIQ